MGKIKGLSAMVLLTICGFLSQGQSRSSALQKSLFTISEAEKILKEKAFLADSSSKVKEGVYTYTCSYTSEAADTKTGKTGGIAYLFEQHPQTSSAAKTYSDIFRSNEKHEGVKVLQGIGDEAYFHSDGQNFYFIMARKGARMFRMKVNKITSKTSLDEFNRIAQEIAKKL
jgi:hypothetical protein